MRQLCIAVSLLPALLPAVILTGCTSEADCGAGREDAEEVVEDFLATAESASSTDDVCSLVSEDNTEAALTLAQSLRDAVVAAGGADELAVDEDPTRRMGSAHAVVASTETGEDLHVFVVEESDGVFRLLPEADAP